MSYNINGFENKYLHPSFFKYINSNDIFVLLETHLIENKFENVKKYFPGFDLYFQAAKRFYGFGRASGGMICGINKNLKTNGIKYESKNISDILYFKFDNENTTFTLVPIYLRPAIWTEEFNNLKMFFENNDITNIILIGDLNVRIGEWSQEVDQIYQELFAAGLEKRKSKDKTKNSQGKQLIDMCTDNNLLILNGRTKGDEEGSLTYLSYLGESVNDICAISLDIVQYIQKFTIANQIWSDHMPIRLKLYIENKEDKIKKLNLLPKLYWKDNKKYEYQQKLDENLERLRLVNVEPSLKTLCDAIKKSSPTTYHQNRSFEQKNNWYDYKCNVAREKSFKCLNIYRNTKCLQDKNTYLKSQKEYKLICIKSKNKYYQQLEIKINSINDSKHWWRTAKEIRNHNYKICSIVSAASFKNYFNELLNPLQKTVEFQYAPILNVDSFLDCPITMTELKKMIRNVKANKAPGEDRVPYEYIVNATDKFLQQLLHIYNNIFETSQIDESFSKTVIFPIHKKGDIDQPSNYRGISFMNSVVKIMMGIINERLMNWVESNKILTEYQAGFRRNYSTADNIYNLSAIVSSKLAEKKKVYAFFVDFKAAFDKVSRNALMYKLFTMGISYKLVRFLEGIYKDTKSAVWTGDDMSEYFETKAGVKQGCLMSPLLFALYINDLSDYLEGGLFIENLNIRLLLYADDIVILADEVDVLSKMILNLEKYCNLWNLEVNLSKSEVMVFRNGGRLGRREKWYFKGDPIKISPEYNYLGVVFTPKLSFNNHVLKRNNQAKNAINTTWKSFLGKTNINLKMKWKLFLAVCRSIQSYAAQTWGFSNFETVDNLQRYFMKKVLKLPSNTPNYFLMLETSAEESHIYTLALHLKYIGKALYYYGENRLPHQLSKILLRRELFWVKDLKEKAANLNIIWPGSTPTEEQWNIFSAELLSSMKIYNIQYNLQEKLKSNTRLYKYLDHLKAEHYLKDDMKLEDISLIMKARSGMIFLNGNRFGVGDDQKLCSLCNLREKETLQHFLGFCPVLQEFRIRSFRQPLLSETEMICILDGSAEEDWLNLLNFLKSALKFRHLMITEYN